MAPPVDLEGSKQTVKHLKKHPSHHTSSKPLQSLSELTFDNQVLRALPTTTERSHKVQSSTPNVCFSRVDIQPVEEPRLVAASRDALEQLDITPELVERELEQFIAYTAANVQIPGADPAAHAYCGHQFGHFSGQLGDGAAMYHGTVVNSKGEHIELQTKGSGMTPYSRAADGRKVLRSSLREFLCSEHMHALGVPTTRAATCITSDTQAIRDIFYTGNPIQEKVTVITRLAPSFLRFGSFEIFKSRDALTGRAGPSVGNKELLNQMLDFTASTYYPEIWQKYDTSNAEQRVDALVEFYTEVVRRTAKLVAQWMSIGWTHAVLNTDNMSILGITIDYGPFGFMERFDWNHTPNASDEQSRYCYGAQPEICKWNCEKLAEAFSLTIPMERLQQALEQTYDSSYQAEHLRLFRNKLGLVGEVSAKNAASDKQLIDDLLDTMSNTSSDFTNVFRALARISTDNTAANDEVVEYILSQCADVSALLKSLSPKVHPQQLQMIAQMIQQDPNLLESLGASPGFITSELQKLQKRKALQGVTNEEKQAKDRTLWKMWVAQYVARLQQDKQAAAGAGDIEQQRQHVQKRANPRFVLRNFLAQRAIEPAEKDDFTEVHRLFDIITDPYDLGDDHTSNTAPYKFSHLAHESKEAEADRPDAVCTWKSQYDVSGAEFQCSCSS